MATLKVTLKNGFFSGTNGCYLQSYEPTRVVANGWDCFLDAEGNLICNASREYGDGTHSMRYTITKSGFSKLTLKVNNGPVRVLKKGFIVGRGQKLGDGTIGLSGGYIDQRYAYFRENGFQAWLWDHGIDRVERADPNGDIPESHYGNHRFETDGKIEWFDETPPEELERVRSHEECSGATWIIIYDIDDSTGGFWISARDVRHTVLRTLKNPEDLNIPLERIF